MEQPVLHREAHDDGLRRGAHAAAKLEGGELAAERVRHGRLRARLPLRAAARVLLEQLVQPARPAARRDP